MSSIIDLQPGVLPKEMTAWVIREERHGEPRQAMQLETVPVPKIGPDEVLIAVMAAGINHNGVWICRGKPIPLSYLKTGYDFHITGSDASGIVWYVGESVKGWKPGDEVSVSGGIYCGQCPECNGLSPLACQELRMWGYETNWGSFAHFAKVKPQMLLPKPPHFTWEEAGAYLACLTAAYHMLVTRARIQAGENVLIWGAAGGLGHYAIQLCLLYGANPIGVVSSDEKAEFCHELGCQWTINRSHFDLSTEKGIREFRKEIRSLTRGQDPDIVFEHVGQATFPTSVFVCNRYGRIVICGATSGFDLRFDVRSLWYFHKSILGAHGGTLYEGAQVNRFVMEKKIRPRLWKVFPFEHLPDGLALMEENEHMGKMAALVQAEAAGLGRKT